MTQEEHAVLKTGAVILIVGGLTAIGYYLIKRISPGTTGPVPVKVSSKCDTSSSAELTIEWNAYQGASSYNIMHKSGTVDKGITGSGTIQHTITGLQLGPINLAIQAVNASGAVIATGAYVEFNVCSEPGDPCYPYYKC